MGHTSVLAIKASSDTLKSEEGKYMYVDLAIFNKAVVSKIDIN